MKTETTKCGEIFRCGPGKFIFSCSYCSDKFNSKSVALNHIETHFLVELSTLATDCIKTENPFGQVNDELDEIAGKFRKDTETEITEGNMESLYIKEEMPINLISENEDCFNPLVDSHIIIDEIQPENTNNSVSKTVPGKAKRKPSLRRKRESTPKIRWGPEIDNNSIVECDTCGNRIKRNSLYSHLLMHKNFNKFICPICSSRFSRRSQLKLHVETHSNCKKYSCDYCGWQFHDLPNLLVHIRRHTGERPYKCEICEKSFTHSNSLVVHNRLHTGERPFSCSLCDRSFVSSSKLNLHKRLHSNEKPYTCELCDKSFKTTKGLREHRRSVHSGKRPYECTECNSKFSDKGILKQHIILHSGVKPYKCRVCELTFAQRAGRRSHERSVHKDVADLIVAKPEMFNSTKAVLPK